MLTCRELYCVICGAHFTQPDILNHEAVPEDDSYLLEYAYDEKVIDSRDVEWLTYFQLLGNSRGPDSNAINVSTDEGVFISSPADWAYSIDWLPRVQSSGDNEQEAPYSFFSSARDIALFPIHGVCLGLLHLFVGAHSNRLVNRVRTVAGFADAFIARLRYCEDHRDELKNSWYFQSGGLEWDHEYFGARAYWTDPWDAEPGMEWLVANPEPGQTSSVDEFLSAWLQHSVTTESAWTQIDRGNQTSLTTSDGSPPYVGKRGQTELMSLPYDILTLITSYLPLRSVLNLHTASRAVHSRLPIIDNRFWHSEVLRLHGDWLVEIHKQRVPAEEGNWRILLQALGIARQILFAPARDLSSFNGDVDGLKTVFQERIQSMTRKCHQLGDLPQFPVGLLNRLRIWCILESIS